MQYNQLVRPVRWQRFNELAYGLTVPKYHGGNLSPNQIYVKVLLTVYFAIQIEGDGIDRHP